MTTKEEYAVANDPTSAESSVKELMAENGTEICYIENIRLIASAHENKAPDLLCLNLES